MIPAREFYHRLNSTFAEVFGLVAEAEKTASLQGTQVEEANPLDESFVKLGDTYIHLKNYQSAFNCYRDAIRINPNNTTAFNRLLLIPGHLLKNSNYPSAYPNTLDEKSLFRLSVNDCFRQTLIGGYIVLSKAVNELKERSVNALLHIIQNLEPAYFNDHADSMREFGVIVVEKIAYVWMINHCNNSPDKDSRSEFPVLILMTRQEYRAVKNLFLG